MDEPFGGVLAESDRATLPLRHRLPPPGLGSSYRGVAVPAGAGFWRKLLAFSGPGYLVAVGYVDPGNWATDIAGGAGFGYRLLFVVLLANLMAMILQALSARLGIATGRDLAQSCRDALSPRAVLGLWLLAEIAICASDLAEVIGTAIALKLLFGLPLLIGVVLTAADVLVLLLLLNLGFRWLEAFVIALLVVIAGCFIIEILLANPDPRAAAAGLIPDPAILKDGAMLYVAIGIVGATVMPHNLYLHSALVQTRRHAPGRAGKAEAIRFASLDATIALTLALVLNAAILIMAAAVFHAAGLREVASITEADRLLAPLLGAPAAGTLFALALLASGQNATLTATMAGQIVMEGFLEIRLPVWLRRIATRLLALAPALLVLGLRGEGAAEGLLVLSQVVLSLQLPFAIVPLLIFTSQRKRMGGLAAPMWLAVLGWASAALLIALDTLLLLDVAAAG